MHDAVQIVAIYYSIRFIGTVFEAIGWLVFVFGQLFPDIVSHGDVNIFLSVVPFEMNSTIQFNFPIFFHVVMLAKDGH